VTVRDYAGNSASQSYTYTVIGQANQPPVADPQTVSTLENTPVDILLTGSDPNHDPLSFSLVSTPTHGTLSGITPNLVYTPMVDYYGPDSFSFSVNDCSVSSEPALVGIDVAPPVNDAPSANPQSLSTFEDTPLDIVLTGSDPNGDPLTYSVVTSPTHGTLSGLAPNLTYTPAANFNGADSFSFVVNDGLVNSEPANVNIDVTAVNDAPIANPQFVTTWQSMPVAITLSGADIDGDDLTYFVYAFPGHGTLSGIAPYLIYTPDLGYSGMDIFSFVVNDGKLDSTPASVGMRINNRVFMPVVSR
jgi:hypothetical protein